jgi:hypothetical protein
MAKTQHEKKYPNTKFEDDCLKLSNFNATEEFRKGDDCDVGELCELITLAAYVPKGAAPGEMLDSAALKEILNLSVSLGHIGLVAMAMQYLPPDQLGRSKADIIKSTLENAIGARGFGICDRTGVGDCYRALYGVDYLKTLWTVQRNGQPTEVDYPHLNRMEIEEANIRLLARKGYYPVRMTVGSPAREENQLLGQMGYICNDARRDSSVIQITG